MPIFEIVFIVDDDHSARTGLTRLLHSAGYAVQSFASADDLLAATESLAAGSTCLRGCLVLDAPISGSSGGHLCAELRARGFDLPVVVVTADDSPRTRQAAMEMNAVGFFRKPVDGTALMDAVDWAIQSK